MSCLMACRQSQPAHSLSLAAEPCPTSLTPLHQLPTCCSFGFHERVRFKKSAAAAPEAAAAAAAAGAGEGQQGGEQAGAEPMQVDAAPAQQEQTAQVQPAEAAAAAEGAAAAAAGPASPPNSRQPHVMGQEVRSACGLGISGCSKM